MFMPEHGMAWDALLSLIETPPINSQVFSLLGVHVFESWIDKSSELEPGLQTTKIARYLVYQPDGGGVAEPGRYSSCRSICIQKAPVEHHQQSIS